MKIDFILIFSKKLVIYKFKNMNKKKTDTSSYLPEVFRKRFDQLRKIDLLDIKKTFFVGSSNTPMCKRRFKIQKTGTKLFLL